MTYRAIAVPGGIAPRDVSAQSAPMLDWVAIDRLVLDDRYQRPLERKNWDLIGKIAGDFRWSRFAPVLVAPVEGGRFAIVDGQHRAHAAAKIGLERIPAQIVPMDFAAQADAFAWVNSHVRPVTKHALYKAALASGEDWAVRAKAAVEAAGCELATHSPNGALRRPRVVYGIGHVERMIRDGLDDVLRVGLGAIVGSAQADEVELYCAMHMKPWCEVLASNQMFLRDVAALSDFLDAFDLIEYRARLSAQMREGRYAGKSLPQVMVPAVSATLRRALMGEAA